MFFTLAFRNVLRQRGRTATTLIAIVSGVVGLVLAAGFVRDIYIQLGEAIIHSQTGHIQIFKEGFLERGTRQPHKFIMDDPRGLSEAVSQIAGVKSASSRLSFAGMLGNGRRDLAIVGEGIEPDKEGVLGGYFKIVEGRSLGPNDQFAALIGQGVAHSLGLKPGDSASILASTADGALNSLELEIVGVFQSFSKEFDARAVRIPLPVAQELMATPGANVMVVTLFDTDQTDAVQSRINALPATEQLDVRHWQSLSDFYEKTVRLYEEQLGVLQWIILLMVLLSVTNSVNMSAFERQSEFGTMRALGNRPAVIGKLLINESVILGFFGASAGVILGVLAAVIISYIGIEMPPPPNANVGYSAMIRLDANSIATAWLVGFIATLAASLIPAFRSARRSIVESLGHKI
ncbi:MAG: ABC transporter permease [Rhodocyclaceae bacterium]|nr:ABC transporter permease [Rhodocyclaceae bacterium]